MAGKRKLEDLLSANQPAIRRGQGVRLSTDREATPPEATIDAKSHDRTTASSHGESSSPTGQIRRVNRGYKLREDLIRRYKRLALDRDQHLYEVMETALEEYLDRQGESRAS